MNNIIKALVAIAVFAVVAAIIIPIVARNGNNYYDDYTHVKIKLDSLTMENVVLLDDLAEVRAEKEELLKVIEKQDGVIVDQQNTLRFLEQKEHRLQREIQKQNEILDSILTNPGKSDSLWDSVLGR